MSWRAAWRIARRDLHARFHGLRLLLVCLFLGTGALAAIGTLTAAIEGELADRGQVLLGGDLQVSSWQRALTEDERELLSRYGRLSEGTRLQAMARMGQQAVPIELKAVDEAYPLFGALTLTDGRKVGAPSRDIAWLSQGAADRLGAGIGDSIIVGTESLRVGGIIEDEPDRLGEGFQLGPTVIVDVGLPERAGLLLPGSMYRTKARLALSGNANPETVKEAVQGRFPNAGFEYKTRDRASPGADRFVERMGEFLTLVGLAALVIAGIGIGGGVTSYLDARRQAIATLKILGATSSDIARIYALQIGAAALVGSLLGIAAGLAIVPMLASALRGLLPVGTGFVISPFALALALIYGLLVALIFASPPLLRARHFPAMALMRARVSPLARDRTAIGFVAGGLAAIVGLLLLTANNPWLTGGFVAGAAGVLALLSLLGWLVRELARRLPRPARVLRRYALGNLHRPGSSTGALVTALGFGLTAFVILAAVQTAIDGNISKRVPAEAPDYFVLDIPRERADAFRAIVQSVDPTATIRTVPALRGSVLAFGQPNEMVRTADLEEIPEDAWALRGERGLTYSGEVPPGNVVTVGAWWRTDHTGEALVSVDEEFARATGLGVGDYLTFGVLGVERTARIANLRRIDWDSMGFNYVFVLSPNALVDAPHNLAGTIELTAGAATAPLLQALVRNFPSSSVIEVGSVLVQARELLSQVGVATMAAASVAVLAGLAVLLGAIAAMRASRTYDTVILRVLGATRRQVLLMQAIEFSLLAAVLAVVALALGSFLGWLVIVELFEFDWLPDWGTILGVLGMGIAIILVFALAGSLPLLRAKPARALRTL